MANSWNLIFRNFESDRKNRLGDFSVKYNIPKYYSLFSAKFKKEHILTFLEVGSGNGEITSYILKQNPTFLKKWQATELTPFGVSSLKTQGISAKQMDAQNLHYRNKSFDVVCAFDVMHHVQNPKKMAHEMTRVAKKYVFLIEANGLSIIRKLLEQTSMYKKLGENSYLPWQYVSFFPLDQFSSFSIHPFLFSPPRIPVFLYPFVIIVSEILERIPFLRWQCSSVVMVGVKK